jgi:PKD repeat protein
MRVVPVLLLILLLAGCSLPQGFLLPDDGESKGDPAAIKVDCPACTAQEGDKFAGPVPLEVTFSAKNYEEYPDASYTWDFDDGGAASTRPDASYTFDETGFYEVTLTVEGEEKTFKNSLIIRVEPSQEPKEPQHLSTGENDLVEAELMAQRDNFDDTEIQVRLTLKAKRELQSCQFQIFARVGDEDSISGKEWQHRWPSNEHPVSQGETLDYRGSAKISDETAYVSAYIHCSEPGWGAQGADLELDELVVK